MSYYIPFVSVFLHLAQVLYLLGSIGVVLTAGTAAILAFRSYASPPGEICLAASTTFLGTESICIGYMKQKIMAYALV